MKLEKTNRVIKNILFVTRMKNGMIIKLLLVMYTAWARLDLNDIKSICKTVAIKEDNLLVHPDGPLNPLRGYIMHRSGYMYNKRLYSPEINTKYSLKKTNEVLDDDHSPSYEYTRKPVNDKVYDDIHEKSEYLTQFHTQLIKMFPSADGSFSIVSGSQDTMYSFLIKDEVWAESMYILAGLFLLSEQINIPINVETKKEEKKLVLKSADGENKYIDQKKPSKDIVNLINFLKKYIDSGSANSNSMEKLPTVPATYEQFMTGEFLNTIQFLVQSYIYEFISTKDKYIEFVEAVHTLL
ncbi:hypothetical protein NEIRO02_2220, partial [Nematocida sp. AWRm79]